MSSSPFYSDRVNGPIPRTHEVLAEPTAEGLKALIARRIQGDCLAKAFPSYCPDGNGITGTNQYDIGPDLSALVPGVAWPLWQDAVSDETLFDVLEYAGQRVAKPSNGEWHSYFRHHELRFDEETGRSEFRAEVNLLLSRGGTVFEMTPKMLIQRVGMPEVQEAFRQLRPATGDATLDSLLETARTLYLSRATADRTTAIEKLWDAFERLKTIDNPSDKRRSVTALLDHIPDTAIRAVVDEEMRTLTALGNQFQIRHHEVGKHPVPANAQDYLASRMATLVVLLLGQSGRLASV